MFEFGNVLSHFSPAQFQQLLASLASQNLTDPTKTGSASPAVSSVNPIATDLKKNTESNLTPYHQQQPFDFSQPMSNFGYPYIDPEALIPFGPYEPSPLTTTTTSPNNNTGANDLTLFNSASSQDREREERMAKEWDNAEIMEDNVNGLHSRIHSLAQALGLDPALLDSDHGGRTNVGAENDVEKNEGMYEMSLPMRFQTLTLATGTATEAVPSSSSSPPAPTTSGTAPPTTGDFDFDFFFNNIGSSSTASGGGVDTEYPSTTFLDEVPTPASSSDQTASPLLSLKHDMTPEMSGGGGDTFNVAAAAAGGGGEGSGPAKGTRKRKSEVDFSSESSTPLTTPRTTTGGNKSKRRKDK